jgi:hypothetical protein
MTGTDDVVNSEINLAVEIIHGRKCANTKIQYFRKVQHFKASIQMEL